MQDMRNAGSSETCCVQLPQGSRVHMQVGMTKPSPPASALLSSNSVMDKLGLCLCIHELREPYICPDATGTSPHAALTAEFHMRRLDNGEPVSSHCVRGTLAILNSRWALFLRVIFSSLGRLLRKMSIFFFFHINQDILSANHLFWFQACILNSSPCVLGELSISLWTEYILERRGLTLVMNT